MRAAVARGLQATGLAVVALALVIGLGEDDRGRELLLLGFGSIVFLAGYALNPTSG